MSQRTLRLVSWNVWFGAWQRAQRQAALWTELSGLDADVVCLQEVLPEHLAGPQFERRRSLGDWIDEELHYDYGVVMLSRCPVSSSERVPLTSHMGRELLLARLAIDPPLTVATRHLESHADMTELRVRQLEQVVARLADEPDVVLCGDMNFPAEPNRPEARVLDGWIDVWSRLRPRDPGFTIDSEHNHMRLVIKQNHDQRRLDRVFVRSERWHPETIELIGTDSLPGDPLTYASDHFGLITKLVAVPSQDANASAPGR